MIRGAVIVAVWLVLVALAATAQDTTDHSAHHPNGTAAPAPVAPSAPSASGDGHSEHHPGGGAASGATSVQAPMTGGMPGMMGMMGRPSKPLYPSLMTLPALTPEQRTSLQADAHARMGRGLALLGQSQAHVQRAAGAGDAAETTLALGHVRDALALIEAGASLLRALDEDRPPPQIALDWYRGQLNLTTPAAVPAHIGPLGLSWFHLVSMAALASFAIVMVALFVGRTRRAAALVQRLGATTPAGRVVSVSAAPAPPVSAPETAASTPPPPAPVPAGGRSGRWSGQLRVAAIFPETQNVRTFRLMVPDDGAIPFSFRPGQFLDVTAALEGGPVKRSYTIASSPTQRDFVEITVKREEMGQISRHLHDRIKQGDLLTVTAPAGTLTFSGTEADSIVLIGGGVGITPLMSVIRYLTDRAWPGEIVLIYCARSTQDFIFRDELEALQRRHRNLQIIATMTRAEGTAWIGLQGYITRELIQQAIPDVGKRRIHLCGPPAMMEALRTQLEALGVPKAQIKTEAFGTPGAVPPMPSGVPAGTTLTPPAGPAPIGPASATIRFALSGKTAPLPPDRTVLEVAEASGVPIDNSCRVGTCGTCKVKLLEGAVTMEVEDGLEPEDKADGFILSCQAKSIGNLVLEA